MANNESVSREAQLQQLVDDWLSIARGSSDADSAIRVCANQLSALLAAPPQEPPDCPEEPNPERVKKLAVSFAKEWLRPNDPDSATPALVDTLSTCMLAFFACARGAGLLAAPPPAPTAKEQHLMDVYDALGVRWGEDPFTEIAAAWRAGVSPLRSEETRCCDCIIAEGGVLVQRVEGCRLEHVSDAEKRPGVSPLRQEPTDGK